jgi:hypothetical protein
MWLEAIIAKNDLVAFLPQLAPVTIHLGGGGTIELAAPTGVELVPDAGLRVTCTAKLNWPVLGFNVPVTLNSATALLKPQIAGSPTGDRLVFTVVVEKADFAGIPGVIDEKITEKINEALVREHAELEWDFTKTLTHLFELPASLTHLRAIGLDVAWGEVRVTLDALVLAVSFRTKAVHDDGSVRPASAMPRIAVDVPAPSAE